MRLINCFVIASLVNGCAPTPPSSLPVGREVSIAQVERLSAGRFGVLARFQNSLRCTIEVEPTPPSGWSRPPAYDVEVLHSGNSGVAVGTSMRAVLIGASAVPVEEEALLFFLPHDSPLVGDCVSAVAGRQDFGFTSPSDEALPELSLADAIEVVAAAPNESDEEISLTIYGGLDS